MARKLTVSRYDMEHFLQDLKLTGTDILKALEAVGKTISGCEVFWENHLNYLVLKKHGVYNLMFIQESDGLFSGVYGTMEPDYALYDNFFSTEDVLKAECVDPQLKRFIIFNINSFQSGDSLL